MPTHSTQALDQPVDPLAALASKGLGDKQLKLHFWQHDWYPRRELKLAVEKVIESCALTQSNPTLVDIGCGDLPYKELFSSRGGRYIGCDIGGSPDVLIEPGKPVPLPPQMADGIVSFQVLEHIWDLEWYLGECWRLLKPGGWLLLSTHGSWLYHPHPGDYRRWTKQGLEKEIEARGFSPKITHPIMGPLAWTTEFRLLGISHFFERIPLAKALFLPVVASLMNVRMMLEDGITPFSIRESNACIYLTLSHKPTSSEASLIPS